MIPMPNNSLPATKPVGVAGAITTALVSTVNVVALVADLSTEVTAGLNLAIGAWVVAASLVVHRRVTPVSEAERGW